MSDASDRLLYGSVLAVAIVAGGTAIWTRVTDGAPPTGEVAAAAPTSSASPARRGEPTRDDVGGVEIVEPPEPTGTSRAGPDFVPDLPAVPDLATEPPPAREDRDDPRMAQLGAEMRILSRARDLLAEHPSEALGVLRRHRRDYPAGVLREEREAYAVEALLALEHVDEAERRYYEFRRDFPESGFTERLAEMMQRPPHEVGAGGR